MRKKRKKTKVAYFWLCFWGDLRILQEQEASAAWAASQGGETVSDGSVEGTEAQQRAGVPTAGDAGPDPAPRSILPPAAGSAPRSRPGGVCNRTCGEPGSWRECGVFL